MRTLHLYSNYHISKQVHNVRKGDYIFLENGLSRKRWAFMFRYKKIDEASLDITYITQEEFFNLQTLPKDFNIVGNPPFSDTANHTDKGSYTSGAKKLYLDFINKALELSDKVVMVAPARGWMTGKNKKRNLELYKKKGLYLIENKGMPFENAMTGEIGVFYFDKTKEFIRDEFEQADPLAENIATQFKFCMMVGEKTPGSLKGTLLNEGAYRVFLTTSKIDYTNDDNLFEDRTRGSWRVAFNHNGHQRNKDAKIYGGLVQVVEPTAYLSKSVSCLIVDDEATAHKIRDYITSQEVVDIQNRIRVSNTNSKYHFSFIPPYEK